jgi:hypothetical protein
VWDVLKVQQVRGVIDRLGYPAHFLVILGVWKVLRAIALTIPRFPPPKEWAYAGVVFNLTGALASHLVSGAIDVGTLVYLIAMMGATAASWALRPPSRRNFPVHCLIILWDSGLRRLCKGSSRAASSGLGLEIPTLP